MDEEDLQLIGQSRFRQALFERVFGFELKQSGGQVDLGYLRIRPSGDFGMVSVEIVGAGRSEVHIAWLLADLTQKPSLPMATTAIKQMIQSLRAASGDDDAVTVARHLKSQSCRKVFQRFVPRWADAILPQLPVIVVDPSDGLVKQAIRRLMQRQTDHLQLLYRFLDYHLTTTWEQRAVYVLLWLCSAASKSRPWIITHDARRMLGYADKRPVVSAFAALGSEDHDAAVQLAGDRSNRISYTLTPKRHPDGAWTVAAQESLYRLATTSSGDLSLAAVSLGITEDQLERLLLVHQIAREGRSDLQRHRDHLRKLGQSKRNLGDPNTAIRHQHNERQRMLGALAVTSKEHRVSSLVAMALARFADRRGFVSMSDGQLSAYVGGSASGVKKLRSRALRAGIIRNVGKRSLYQVDDHQIATLLCEGIQQRATIAKSVKELYPISRLMTFQIQRGLRGRVIDV